MQNLPPAFSIEMDLAILGSQSVIELLKGIPVLGADAEKTKGVDYLGRIYVLGHAAPYCIFEYGDCGWDIHFD